MGNGADQPGWFRVSVQANRLRKIAAWPTWNPTSAVAVACTLGAGATEIDTLVVVDPAGVLTGFPAEIEAPAGITFEGSDFSLGNGQTIANPATITGVKAAAPAEAGVNVASIILPGGNRRIFNVTVS